MAVHKVFGKFWKKNFHILHKVAPISQEWQLLYARWVDVIFQLLSNLSWFCFVIRENASLGSWIFLGFCLLCNVISQSRSLMLSLVVSTADFQLERLVSKFWQFCDLIYSGTTYTLTMYNRWRRFPPHICGALGASSRMKLHGSDPVTSSSNLCGECWGGRCDPVLFGGQLGWIRTSLESPEFDSFWKAPWALRHPPPFVGRPGLAPQSSSPTMTWFGGLNVSLVPPQRVSNSDNFWKKRFG